MSEWRTAWFCVSCEQRLSWDQVMHSFGRCPMCGCKGRHAGTIVDTFERAYRVVRVEHASKWWQFWKPKRIEWREEDPNPNG